jgi:protein-L-isoaspartate(D-aspartate) O-methyltransferase
MDIEKARFNMIEQQVRPWDVLDPEILEILALVRREEFVPPAYRELAFADVEIPLNIDGKRTGQSMFTPKLEARLLQSLGVRRHEAALEIGTGSGYGTALLAQRTRKIQSWEIDPTVQAFAADNLRRAGIVDVRLHCGDGSRMVGEDRFDVIILSGSVAEDPDVMLARLNDTRIGKGCTSVDLFETVAPRLQGFPSGKRFKF